MAGPEGRVKSSTCSSWGSDYSPRFVWILNAGQSPIELLVEKLILYKLPKDVKKPLESASRCTWHHTVTICFTFFKVQISNWNATDPADVVRTTLRSF